MSFRFHLPSNRGGISEISKDNPEGPKKGNIGRSQKKSKVSKGRRLRGNSGTAWQRSSDNGAHPESGRRRAEGPEGPATQGYSRLVNKHSLVDRKVAQDLIRSRQIVTRVVSNVPRDFGPFKRIAKFGSNWDIGIEDVRESKKLLHFDRRISVAVRFYVNIDQIRRYNITSALVTLENAKANLNSPLPQFSTIVDINKTRQEFQAAHRRYRRSVIDEKVVNLSELHSGESSVFYDFSLSNSNYVNLASGYVPSEVTRYKQKVQRDRSVSSNMRVKSYTTQMNDWSKGMAEDPGASINSMPGNYSPSSNYKTDITSRKIDIYSKRESDLPGTGAGVHASRMGDASASLFRGSRMSDSRQRFSYSSRFVPVLVNLYLTAPTVNTKVKVRIQLKSQNLFTNQVIASGSKKINLTKRIQACKSVVEAPTIRARYSQTAEGGDWYNITVRQKDDAATHISIYGKPFDSSGNSMKKGWSLLRTVPCTTRRGSVTTSINTNVDSIGSYSSIALRAVSTNKRSMGSKFSSTTLTNPRPNILKSYLHTVETMPCVSVVNSSKGIDVIVRNTRGCKMINIMREDISDGKNKLMHARVIKNTDSKIGFRDTRVKQGNFYRYYVTYFDPNVSHTMMASHKDAIIKRSALDTDADGIDLSVDSHTINTGSNPTLDDDSVKIILQLRYNDDGLTKVVQILQEAGIEASKSKEISKISQNFNNMFGIKVSRTHVQSGEKVSYGYYRIGKDVKSILIEDTKNVREKLADKNFGKLIPGDTYVYNFRLHKTTIPELLGGDDTSESELQNPKLSLSLLSGSRRRFLKNSDTARGILPSESFVKDNTNYGSLEMAFSRGFTGIEVNYEVKIPETNSRFKTVRVRRLSREMISLMWSFEGDFTALDHFVVYEMASETKTPIGARLSATRGKSRFLYHIIENLDQYDRSYLVEAYGDDGQLIDTIETEIFSPPSPISNDIIRETTSRYR